MMANGNGCEASVLLRVTTPTTCFSRRRFGASFTWLLACASWVSAATAAGVHHGDKPDILAADTDRDFDDFISKHGRSYARGDAEYQKRQKVFAQAVEKVRAQNSKPGALWKAGLNKLADRTDAELAMLRGRKGPRGGSYSRVGTTMTSLEEASSMPESFNWRNLQTSKVIKDQQSCGSCWAVTTVTVLEANYEIWVNRTSLRSFSAQELVSCVPNPRHCGGTGGCDGATVELGMDYIMNRSIYTEEYAPYHARDLACAHVLSGDATTTVQIMPVLAEASTTSDPSVKDLTENNHGAVALPSARTKPPTYLTGWNTLPVNKLDDLMHALVQKGPVAVSVAAGNWSFYSSGIFDQCEKDTVVDHAVSLYGYGAEGSTKYWLIRNSWGSSWGEDGFLRLLRHSNEEEANWCGTDNDPSKGVACEGGPSKVTVCGMCGILYDSVIPNFEDKQGRGSGLLQRRSLVRRAD